MASSIDRPAGTGIPFDQASLLAAARADTFSRINNIRVTQVSPSQAQGELTVTSESLNPWGMVHGGCLATLADTVAGSLILANGHKCVTLDCSMHYLRPATGAYIRCTARPRKLGGTVSVVSVSLTDSQDMEVASGVYTFYRLGDVDPKELSPAVEAAR